MADDERITDLEELWEDEPDDALTGFMLGGEYARAGRPQEAAAVLARVVAIDPDYSAAWGALAQAQEDAGERQVALTTWRRAADCAAAKGDHLVAKAAAAGLERLGG